MSACCMSDVHACTRRQLLRCQESICVEHNVKLLAVLGIYKGTMSAGKQKLDLLCSRADQQHTTGTHMGTDHEQQPKWLEPCVHPDHE